MGNLVTHVAKRRNHNNKLKALPKKYRNFPLMNVTGSIYVERILRLNPYQIIPAMNEAVAMGMM